MVSGVPKKFHRLASCPPDIETTNQEDETIETNNDNNTGKSSFAKPKLDVLQQDSFWRTTTNIGQRLPEDLYLGVDINGKEVTLGDYRGQKVMICFYLFTQCGVCAYSIGKLMGSYKTLAWASKLKVVTVFRTEVKHLKAGLTDESSPIPRLLDCAATTAYPFDAVADPNGVAAESFGCNTSNMFKTFLANRKNAPKMMKRVITNSMVRREAMFAAKHGAGNLLPSEFLVDEDGRLQDVMRATKSTEHMSKERITDFLLMGAKEMYDSKNSLSGFESRRITVDVQCDSEEDGKVDSNSSLPSQRRNSSVL